MKRGPLTDLPPSVLYRPGVISASHAATLAETFMESAHLLRRDQEHPFWDRRVIPADAFPEGSMTRLDMETLAVLVGGLIASHFAEPVLWSDMVHMVRWDAGDGMSPHYDACPGLEYRKYGSVLYLNDTYHGGNFYMPNLRVEIEPEVGSLIAFPGDVAHTHGVRPIRTGRRYTFPNFWTDDPEKAPGGVRSVRAR